MADSNEVFAKRKQGQLDEAYELALQLVKEPGAGEWEQSALAWCLIDLIKREARAGNTVPLEDYRVRLERITPSSKNEILSGQRDYALSLCRPDSRLRAEAKALSQNGAHAQAVEKYHEALAAQPGDVGLQTALGWELYRHGRQLLTQEPTNIGLIKRNLSEYLKLNVEKPALLHSCMLQQATQLAGQDSLNMLAFSRLWNLDALRSDDFERFRAEDGKSYPALAEKVIRLAAKAVIASRKADDLDYLRPYLDDAIVRYPDNLWLKHAKAKALLALGRYDEALQFAVLVTKAKPGEYWAWELLGDVCAPSNPAAALACYCKGLTCSDDETFLGKLRLKLAEALIAAGELARAKWEVERVIAFRMESGQKLPDAASQIATQSWYADTGPAESNRDYHRARAADAEALLLRDMPWIPAVIGERFTVSTAEGKTRTRRRMFMDSGGATPREISIRDSELPFRNASPGEPVQLKGEFETGDKFHLYKIERRPGANWDVVPAQVGVIDHINEDKQVAHVIVARDVDGVLPLSALAGPIHVGETVAVRLAIYMSKQGERYRILSAEPTSEPPDAAVLKPFESTVRASGSMGFTDNDIFIPPDLMKTSGVTDGGMVSGLALLNFNKKRKQWGWKAISVSAMP